MKKNRFVLPLIIILLVLSLPLGIYGLINELSGNNENPNKSHIYKQNLYYYDETGKLLFKYPCKSSNCDDVTIYTDPDDKIMHPVGSINKIGKINKDYAFIYDNNSNGLYLLKTNMKIFDFDSLKNYNEENNEGYILYKKDNKWGVFDTVNISKLTEPIYDYIGYLKNEPITTFVVKEDNKYYLTSLTEKVSIDFTKPIVYFTDELIVIQNDEYYQIYEKSGDNNTVLLNQVVKFDDYNGALVCILSNNNIFIIKNSNTKKHLYTGVNDTDYKIEGNSLNVLLNGEIERSFNLDEEQ